MGFGRDRLAPIRSRPLRSRCVELVEQGEDAAEVVSQHRPVVLDLEQSGCGTPRNRRRSRRGKCRLKASRGRVAAQARVPRCRSAAYRHESRASPCSGPGSRALARCSRARCSAPPRARSPCGRAARRRRRASSRCASLRFAERNAQRRRAERQELVANQAGNAGNLDLERRLVNVRRSAPVGARPHRAAASRPRRASRMLRARADTETRKKSLKLNIGSHGFVFGCRTSQRSNALHSRATLSTSWISSSFETVVTMSTSIEKRCGSSSSTSSELPPLKRKSSPRWASWLTSSRQCTTSSHSSAVAVPLLASKCSRVKNWGSREDHGLQHSRRDQRRAQCSQPRRRASR